MAEVLLFHHALGVTAGIMAFADRLRDGGHQVTVGDLFGGTTFDTIEEGVAFEEGLGWDEMVARSAAAAAPLPQAIVIGGFSLGAVYAQRLVQKRDGALGALLYHSGDVPVAEFGAPWPEGARLQIHVSEGDEWFDREGGEQLAMDAGGELFLYPGSAHLFTDSSWKEYDAAATDLVLERSLAMLDGV
jgi:dienelactone hydrolase